MAIKPGKLGLKKVRQRELVTTRTKEGVQNFKWDIVEREELSSLLTVEEARVLGPDQKWSKMDGMFMTSVEYPDGRRRFFCEVDPFANERGTKKSGGVAKGGKKPKRSASSKKADADSKGSDSTLDSDNSSD